LHSVILNQSSNCLASTSTNSNQSVPPNGTVDMHPQIQSVTTAEASTQVAAISNAAASSASVGAAGRANVHQRGVMKELGCRDRSCGHIEIGLVDSTSTSTCTRRRQKQPTPPPHVKLKRKPERPLKRRCGSIQQTKSMLLSASEVAALSCFVDKKKCIRVVTAGAAAGNVRCQEALRKLGLAPK
jgi:hypothetical protein